MQSPLQISYRHMERSESLDALIRVKAEHLEHLFDRTTGCRVVVESPSPHHRDGGGAHFRVRVDLQVPGETLVIGNDALSESRPKDAVLAVTEAFRAMQGQLERYVGRLHKT